MRAPKVQAVAVLFALASHHLGSALRAQQAEDQPFGLMSDACSARFLEAIDPCVRQARATFQGARDRYLAGLPDGNKFYVVARIRDSEGRVEQIFVRVEHIEGLPIRGRLANEPLVVNGFALADPVRFSSDEIVDWLIVRPDGSEEGNIVGKYLDAVQAGQASGKCSGS